MTRSVLGGTTEEERKINEIRQIQELAESHNRQQQNPSDEIGFSFDFAEEGHPLLMLVSFHTLHFKLMLLEGLRGREDRQMKKEEIEKLKVIKFDSE